MKTSLRIPLGFLALAVVMAMEAPAQVSITAVAEFTRPSVPEGLSGITYAGGGTFFTVDDSGGLMWPAQIDVNRGNGQITSCVIPSDSSVKLNGGVDLEGIAYNPANDSVFVSDETGATIKEYALSGGDPLSVVDIPDNLLAYRKNFSLESLTIRGDGLEMWTCNEEALHSAVMGIDDGPLSDNSYGSIVRLTRFSRADVHAAWEFSGQWAYQCEPYTYGTYGGSERSGVADLCALPDGTLLVLERAFSATKFIIDIPEFKTRIYEVDFSGATEVSGIQSLNGAAYTKTSKRKLWEKTFMTTNYEGICLGPRLNDGSTSLLLVSDGDSPADQKLYALKLSGLDVYELFAESPYGLVTPYGGPYRYVAGDMVEARALIDQAGADPYFACTGWSLAAPQPDEGAGGSAVFAISGDSVLTWNWEEITAGGLPIADSFESYAPGTPAEMVFGWSGSGEVVEVDYEPAMPPGFPLPAEPHTRVLSFGGSVERSVESEENMPVNIDLMLRLMPWETLPEAPERDAQVVMLMDPEGFLNVWHYARDAGGNWAKRWTAIWPEALPFGSWQRISLTMDYASGASGDTFFQPRLNGSLCPTEFGFKSPGELTSPGSWYVCSDSPGRSGAGGRQVTEVSFGGDGMVDDFVVTTDGFAHSGPTETNGVEFSWFDSWGIARNPDGDPDADGLTNRDEYIAGTSPVDGASVFRVVDTRIEGGRVYVSFTGNDSGALTPYLMERTDDPVSGEWVVVDDDIPRVAAPGAINTWSEPIPEGGDTFFYRPVAVE